MRSNIKSEKTTYCFQSFIILKQFSILKTNSFQHKDGNIENITCLLIIQVFCLTITNSTCICERFTESAVLDVCTYNFVHCTPQRTQQEIGEKIKILHNTYLLQEGKACSQIHEDMKMRNFSDSKFKLEASVSSAQLIVFYK